MRRLVPILLFVLAFVGCRANEALPAPDRSGAEGERPAARAAAAALAPGLWWAELASPGGPLHFGLRLEPTADGWQASLVNGRESISIPEATLTADGLVLSMDHYDARIEATISDAGDELIGEWTKRRAADDWTRMSFRARNDGAREGTPAAALHPGVRAALRERGLAARALLGGGAAFDAERLLDGAPSVTGRWRVDFESDAQPAVGVFERLPDGHLAGTFLTTTGDYRFLAGHQIGDRVELSCFDGAHAFLFRARLVEGELRGDFWSRDKWHETWRAHRDETASLPDGFTLTRWTGDGTLGELRFPDLDGKVRSLDDPELAGRARILQVFGSWCPNCHDASELMVELDRRYRDRGLSIVGLAFELTGDFERDAEQVRRYAARHGVEYPLLVSGLADKAEASASFPALDRVRSYPTTIFLHGDGRVRAVYQGFSGPATGETHEELVASFEAIVEELLGE